MTHHLHPFECYKLYHKIRFFFKTDWCWFNRTNLSFNFAKFENSPNFNAFESLSRTYDETELEDIFVSNLLEDPDRHIRVFLKKGRTLAIRDQWYERVKNADNIFAHEIDSFAREWNIESLRELGDALFCSGAKRLTVETRTVETLEEVVSDEDFDFSFSDNVKLRALKDRPMEFLVLLDESFLMRWNRSFLKEQWAAAPVAFEPFLRAFKYKSLLPIDDLMKQPIVKDFVNAIDIKDFVPAPEPEARREDEKEIDTECLEVWE